MDLVFFSDFKVIAAQAKKLKEKEIIFAKHFESEGELALLQQRAKPEKIAIKLCHVLEKLEEKEIKAFKGKADFLAVRGGTIAANKFAANSKQIDFLLHPASTQRFEFDSAIANTCRENNVALAALFSNFLNAPQYDLVSLFRNYFLLAKVCKRSQTKMLVFSGAQRAEEMRCSLDLESFLVLLKQTNVDEEDY